MVVVCQLSLRSQGVPSWSANSKIASSYREKVNWARVVLAVRPFKRGMVRINRTQGRAAYCFLLQRLRGKEIHHKDKRARQQSWKSLSLSFRQHQHLFFFLSHSLLFSLHALIVEERTQTWTEPWTQMLVNTFTFFSLSYSVLIFVFLFFFYYFILSVVCYASGSQQVFLWMLNSHCLWAPQGTLFVCNVVGVGCCTWLINADSHPSLMWRDQVQLNGCSGHLFYKNMENKACWDIFSIDILARGSLEHLWMHTKRMW